MVDQAVIHVYIHIIVFSYYMYNLKLCINKIELKFFYKPLGLTKKDEICCNAYMKYTVENIHRLE